MGNPVQIRVTGHRAGCCDSHSAGGGLSAARVARVDTGEDITDRICCHGNPPFPWRSGDRMLLTLFVRPLHLDGDEVAKEQIDVVVAHGHDADSIERMMDPSREFAPCAKGLGD